MTTALLAALLVLGQLPNTGNSQAAQTMFQKAKRYPVGSTPRHMATGLFNGDVFQDLAVVVGGTNSVKVFLSNSVGALTLKQTISTGAGPIGIVAFDFNGDGRTDLATANRNAGTISILIGNGDGTFQAAVDYPTGAGCYSLAGGALASQTAVSLVCGIQTTANIFVLPGIGDGGFFPAINYGVDGGGAGGLGFLNINMADMDNDGNVDIVGADNWQAGDFVRIWMGLQDGGFDSFQSDAGSPIAFQLVPNETHATQWALPYDCNNDGILDLGITDTSGAAHIIAGHRLHTGGPSGPDSQLSFQRRASYWGDAKTTGAGPAAIGDLNGDGFVDFVTDWFDASNVNNGVKVFFGTGSCGLTPPLFLPVNNPNGFVLTHFIWAISLADLNGDGRPDIIAADRNDAAIYVWLSVPTTQVSMSQGSVVKVSGGLGAEPIPTAPLSTLYEYYGHPLKIPFTSTGAQTATRFQPGTCVTLTCSNDSAFMMGVDEMGPATADDHDLYSKVPKDICFSTVLGTVGDYLVSTAVSIWSVYGGVCKISKRNYH